MNAFIDALRARQHGRVLRSSVSAMLIAGLGIGTIVVSSDAHAQPMLGGWEVTATVGGGSGGTGGGGSYRIYWDTSNNSVGGLETVTDPAVAAAFCLAMDQQLAANGCDSVPPPSPPNGCGPVAGVAPPQGVGSANFNFACNSHDICYSSLAVGKPGCDGRFWNDLVAECQRAYWDDIQTMRETQPSIAWADLTAVIYAVQLTCIGAGNSYAAAVTLGGDARYASAQATARCQSFRDAKAGLGCGNG